MTPLDTGDLHDTVTALTAQVNDQWGTTTDPFWVGILYVNKTMGSLLSDVADQHTAGNCGCAGDTIDPRCGAAQRLVDAIQRRGPEWFTTRVTVTGLIPEPAAEEPLVDPDCLAGKHGSCVGGPCQCDCHTESDGVDA